MSAILSKAYADLERVKHSVLVNTDLAARFVLAEIHEQAKC